MSSPTHPTMFESIATGLATSALYDFSKAVLSAAEPDKADLKNGLAISYANLAQFHRDHTKDLPQAQAHFQQAEHLWVELVRDAPQYAEFQQFLAQVRAFFSCKQIFQSKNWDWRSATDEGAQINGV